MRLRSCVLALAGFGLASGATFAHEHGIDQQAAPGGTPAAGTLAFNPAFATTVLETAPTGPIVVTRSGGTAGAISVPYSIQPLSATASVDFVAQDGVFTWSAGESGNRSANYMLVDDLLLEGPESFTVTLGTPTGGAVLGAPSQITVTIEDDEDHIHSNGFEGGGGRQ